MPLMSDIAADVASIADVDAFLCAVYLSSSMPPAAQMR
jgi:hypothetical protein